MSIAAVKTKWEDEIYTNATIKKYSLNLHSYDLVDAMTVSNAHEAKAYYNSELVFIQFVYNGNTVKAMTGQEQTTYNITVSFYKKCDLDGDNYNDIINFFEALYAVIKSELGDTWGGLVDFWNVPEELPEITTTTLNNVAVWAGTQVYEGILTS